MNPVRPIYSLEMLQLVAEALKQMKEDVVFTGGATVALYVDDPASAAIRATDDVDCVIEVAGHAHYYSQVQNRLGDLGFTQKLGTIMCRWYLGTLAVDIMPTDAKILGFANQWYGPGMNRSERCMLGNGIQIRIFTLPFFLATKIEAYRGRGNNDLMGSHDFEDIVAVIDGNKDPLKLFADTPRNVITFLRETFAHLSSEPAFQDAVLGHLEPGATRTSRYHRFMKIVESITQKKI